MALNFPLPSPPGSPHSDFFGAVVALSSPFRLSPGVFRTPGKPSHPSDRKPFGLSLLAGLGMPALVEGEGGGGAGFVVVGGEGEEGGLKRKAAAVEEEAERPDKKMRGHYACRRCGMPKRGHGEKGGDEGG